MGPYLAAAGPAVRQKFGDAFIDMTVGFLAFPLCVPGTAVWRGRAGRLYILSVLETAAGQSKAAMKARPLAHQPNSSLASCLFALSAAPQTVHWRSDALTHGSLLVQGLFSNQARIWVAYWGSGCQMGCFRHLKVQPHLVAAVVSVAGGECRRGGSRGA